MVEFQAQILNFCSFLEEGHQTLSQDLQIISCLVEFGGKVKTSLIYALQA